MVGFAMYNKMVSAYISFKMLILVLKRNIMQLLMSAIKNFSNSFVECEK